MLLLLGCNALALLSGLRALEERRERIAAIQTDRAKEHERVMGWFAEGAKGPDDMPWVDISDPFWCSWYARPKAILAPSPLFAIAPGRSADNPWFADLAYFSNAYSPSLAPEIGDPEHRQLGTFDAVFVLIYLMPLSLLALLFDVGGAERDRGTWTLVRSHTGGMRSWLALRFLVPMLAVWLVTVAPLALMAARIGAPTWPMLGILVLATAYLLLWVLLLLAAGMARGTNDQALRGAIAHAAFCLVLPGVLQWAVKLQHPPSLMLGYITADRIGSQAVYELEPDTIARRFYALHPGLRDTPHGRDTTAPKDTDWMMASALVSAKMDSVVREIAAADRARIGALRRSAWWLPSAAIPLAMERLARTDACTHLDFRLQAHERGKRILRRLMEDSWNERRMDAAGFREYAGPEGL